MCEDAIGCSSDGEDSVKAEAELAEIASIATPARAATAPPVRTRVNMKFPFVFEPALSWSLTSLAQATLDVIRHSPDGRRLKPTLRRLGVSGNLGSPPTCSRQVLEHADRERRAENGSSVVNKTHVSRSFSSNARQPNALRRRQERR